MSATGSPFASLRPVFRALSRNRVFTVAAIVTLGLGMGAATAIYTLLERVVLDPLPYPHADRLVRLKNAVPGVGASTQWDASTAQFFYYTEHATRLSRVGLYSPRGGVLSTRDGSPAERVQTAVVSASMMDLLGAHAARGRLLGPDDDRPGAPQVGVLSYAYWRRAFGGAPSVIGSLVHLNDEPVEIIGVMAPGIELPAEPGEGVPTETALWTALRLSPAGPFYNNHVYGMIARRAPGATLAAAQAELARLTPQLPAAFPKAYSERFFTQYGFRPTLIPLRRYVVGKAAGHLWILFGAVGLVLVIACANVINLLLVRLEARRRELAVRCALGAGWRNLAADALREGLVLSAAAAVLGLVLAVLGTRALVALAPPGVPRLANIHVDGRVLAFALVLGLGVAVLLAVIPALRARLVAPGLSLGDGGRTVTAGRERQRLRSTLVVSQVALALVLVVCAGLLLRSFARLRSANAGFDPHGVLRVDLALSAQRYDSAYKVWDFYTRLLPRIAALPAVRSAGLSNDLPLEGGYGCTVQGFEDNAVYQRVQDAGETTCAGQTDVSPGYFRAMGIPVLEGRDLTAADNAAPAAGAVVVSKAFADRFWPGEDPIGKGVGPNGRNQPPFAHVVGVVGDIHAESIDGPAAIAIYYPMMPVPAWGNRGADWSMTLVVRGTGDDPMALLAPIRRAVSDLDPTIPLANAADMETVVARSMSQLTFTMTLLGLAGLTALVLAAVGLYGVISYIVTRRTNELGVRLALGAEPAQVRGLVVGSALRLTTGGLVLGAAAALAFARLLASLLYGIRSWDPVSYALAALVLASVAVLAAWVPARRAAALDPTIALRSE